MLKQLKTHHRDIARLRFEGVAPKDIAERLNMSVHTVNLVLRDPLCRSYLDGLQDRSDENTLNVRRELSKMNSDALGTLKFLLTQGDVPASVQLGAAKDVLDRNGYRPPERHEHLQVHITSEDIAELHRRRESILGSTDVSRCEPTQLENIPCDASS